jgi:hypothetical protein
VTGIVVAELEVAAGAGGAAYTYKCNGKDQPVFFKDTCTFAQCDQSECRARCPEARSGTFTISC